MAHLDAAIFSQVDRVAQSNAPVVITGESGVGKELLAAAIHRRSQRASADLVPINCGAIANPSWRRRSSATRGSTLAPIPRGRVRSSRRTLARSFSMRSGSCRSIDSRSCCERWSLAKVKPIGRKASKVDYPFICATNRNLGEEIRFRRFREDLFFRLAVVTLQLPPLRHRLGDVPLLWADFMRQLGTTTIPLALSEAARTKLLDHRWPGNVRELRNVAQRALLTCMGTVVGPEHIVFDPHTLDPASGTSDTINPVGLTLSQFEAAGD